ncbi:MAG TPA: wax ester/triacylglycerol synthase family O-acyltransferase [Frankiaceae bacterium]|nr:wax ester/triacylglycerol synthase family O-acyltransferase [Frankiaceae bacterium]
MPTTEEELTPLDATFLELEQVADGALMHIGAALAFDAPDEGDIPTREHLVDLLELRFGLLPGFRRRLSEPRVHGLRRPGWVPDESFDLRAHVRHARLPEPGTQDQLHDWLSDFWSHRLDRARPLWEVALVDGLQDGGWVLATKTHHAMVDGVGSMDVGHVLLDAEPHPVPSQRGEPSAPEVSDHGPVVRLPGWLSQAVSAAQAAAETIRHPSRLVQAGQAAVAMSEVVWRDEVRAARHSTLNVPIGATRRFTSVTFDLAEAKRIKQALGGTVNDVVLAVTTGALRRLLESRGEPLDEPLRAMVPVNLRGSADHSGAGNIVSSLFVELPIGESELRHRYDRTRAAATELKSGRATLGTSAILLVAGLAPPILHGSIAPMLYGTRMFNLTVTNVPGPQLPLYALGSRLRRVLPLVPLAADHTLGLAIVSYAGGLTFGVNADRASTPDLKVFEHALRDEFAGLAEVARTTAG